MKYFIFLLLVAILPFSVLAQNKFRSFPLEEPIFYTYYKPYTEPVYKFIKKYDELSSKYVKSILTDGNSYLYIKNNKNYTKIEFEINGIKLYCSGKIKFKNNRNYFKIEPSSDLFYLSNNQIFCGLKDIEEFKLKNSPTIHNEDGSYLFHKELNEDQITQKVISQKSNTNHNFIINTYKDDIAPDVYNEKYGYVYPNSFYDQDPFVIAPQSKEISTIEIRKVNGALADYNYTTKKENTATYSYNEKVFDGYKTIPCPTCNGTGNKRVDNSVRVFKRNSFLNII